MMASEAKGCGFDPRRAHTLENLQSGLFTVLQVKAEELRRSA